MSFLGVGAPEALLVAVVALVVFGPKGLAEVRNGFYCMWK
jgi:sec-independent protein translocase protein TatA